MKKRIRRRQNITPDLDITAFLNLMVILVPFLLITAVFSRIAVLDLYLPPESKESSVQREKFRLEIILRHDQIAVKEAGSGFSKIIPLRNGEFNYRKLSDYIAMLKLKFPEKRVASILPEPDVPYDVLIQVMDHVRMREVSEKDGSVTQELFPGISIGDAPSKSGRK